jgi:hypothetical protein
MSSVNLRKDLRVKPVSKAASAARTPVVDDRVPAHIERLVRTGFKDVIERSVRREVAAQLDELLARMDKMERAGGKSTAPLRKAVAKEEESPMRPITRNNGEVNEVATAIKALHRKARR